MESWRQVVEIALEWPFAAVAALILLLASAGGAGRWHARWRRSAWVAALLLLGFSLSVGLGRQEWRDVLFNGQLL
jgi:hypothetical protein